MAASIFPQCSIDYYNSVRTKLGQHAVDESYRLYMVPGMNHCQGGEGADRVDMQSAIEAWVERGQPPTSVIASKIVNDAVVRTHPLCPYPQEAVYKGSGIPSDAANFECKAR